MPLLKINLGTVNLEKINLEKVSLEPRACMSIEVQ